MEKLNDNAAANLNLKEADIKNTHLVVSKSREFSEELADGGEKNDFINDTVNKNKRK